MSFLVSLSRLWKDLLRSTKETEWQRFLRLADSRMREIFEPIADPFLSKDSIDVNKFSANWNAIKHRSAESYFFYAQAGENKNEEVLAQHLTKIIKIRGLLGGVPFRYPNWFVAAYPDVVTWATQAANSDNENKIFLVKVLGAANKEELEELQLFDEEKHFNHECLRKLVDYYIRNINPVLECFTQARSYFRLYLLMHNLSLINAKIVVAIALLLALAHWPYAYYQLLRWAVCGIAAFSAYQEYKQQKRLWMWIFVGLAILFNPIAPIHFTRDVWQIFDVGAAVTILLSLFYRGFRQ